VFLLRRLVERIKELIALGYGYLQSLIRLLARFAFLDEPSSAPVRHNASIVSVMTYRPDFSGCWAKLERAREHRNALDAEIDAVERGERDQVPLVSEFDSKSGYYIFTVAALPDTFLTRVGLLISDVTHNLWCVLDHIVWQLTRVKTGGSELTGSRARRARFPIVRSCPFPKVVPREFGKGDALKDVLPDHRTLIEGFQPYHTIDPYRHPLAILRDLTDRDKHRVVLPVLLRTRSVSHNITPQRSVPPDRIVSPSTVDIRWTGAGDLEVGAEVQRVKFRDDIHFDPHVEMQSYMTPKVTLPQGDGVVSELDHIAAYVVHVLGEFEPLF
jgi:hypothetical protein